ncbi:MAG: hypothetical protein AB7N91_27895 [Candidatus Tectimicrobiota bacterium]
MRESQSSTMHVASPNATGFIDSRSYVEWGAVLGGAFVVVALSFLFFTFGTAIGLSVISPWASEGVSATTLGFGAAFWFIVVETLSFAAGGYLAGRMRARRGDATAHEVEVRDGSHGLLVWAVAAVFGMLFAAATTTSVTKSGAELGGSVISGVASAAGTAGAALGQSGQNNATDYFVDMFFRSENSQGGGLGETRDEVKRILMRGAVSGELSPADRTYLAQSVSQYTGLPLPEAEKRVNDVLTQVKQAADSAAATAREAADATRKVTAVIGFLTAATLLLSAMVAWGCAGLGGKHREAGTSPLFMRS